MRHRTLSVCLLALLLILLFPSKTFATGGSEYSGLLRTDILPYQDQPVVTQQQTRTRHQTNLIKSFSANQVILQVTETFGIVGPGDFVYLLPNSSDYSLNSEVTFQTTGVGACQRGNFQIKCNGTFQTITIQFDEVVIPTLTNDGTYFEMGGYNGLPRDFALDLTYPSNIYFINSTFAPIAQDSTTIRWFKANVTSLWVVGVTLSNEQSTAPLPNSPELQPLIGNNSDAVTVSWKALPNATFYELQVSTDNSFPSIPMTATTTLTPTQTSLIVSKTAGDFFFRLRGCSSTTCSPYTTTASFIITATPFRILIPIVVGQTSLSNSINPTGTIELSDAVDEGQNPINPRFIFSYGIKRMYVRATVNNAKSKQVRVTFSIGISPESTFKQAIPSDTLYIYNDFLSSCSAGTCGINPLPRTVYTFRIYVDDVLKTTEIATVI